jgi:hypothetical protein
MVYLCNVINQNHHINKQSETMNTNSDDTMYINPENNPVTSKKSGNSKATMAATAGAGFAVGTAAGIGSSMAFASDKVEHNEDDVQEAVESQSTQTETQSTPQQHPHRPNPPQNPEQEQATENNIEVTPITETEPETTNTTGTTGTTSQTGQEPEIVELPEIEENPDDVVDEILAVEEIDPADIDGTEVFQFNELTTVYTVDGQELTAATFQMDNGFEGMIVDVDGDGVFDDMATLDGYSVGQAPLLTVDDVEMELNPSTEYLAQNDDIDHTLTDDTYMDDMIDLA